MLGLALSLDLPGSGPVGIFVMCIEAAAFALALGVPLTAIILIIVMSNPSPELIVLIVISATTGLVLGALLEQMKARRIQNQADTGWPYQPLPDTFFFRTTTAGSNPTHLGREDNTFPGNGLDMLKKDGKAGYHSIEHLCGNSHDHLIIGNPGKLTRPSQPREKFGLPVRTVWATESEQTDWIPENEACIRRSDPE